MESVILLFFHNANLASIKILVKGFGIDRIDDILSPVFTTWIFESLYSGILYAAYSMLHITTDIDWNN